jgi:hypothetical protein
VPADTPIQDQGLMPGDRSVHDRRGRGRHRDRRNPGGGRRRRSCISSTDPAVGPRRRVRGAGRGRGRRHARPTAARDSHPAATRPRVWSGHCHLYVGFDVRRRRSTTRGSAEPSTRDRRTPSTCLAGRHPGRVPDQPPTSRASPRSVRIPRIRGAASGRVPILTERRR